MASLPFQDRPDRRWPVDATPFPNEVADSWLIRMFWQMGIDPTPWRLEHRLPSFETPWHHPLSKFCSSQIEALACRTGLSSDQIAALALDHDSAPPQTGSAMPDLVRDPDLVMAVAPRFLRLREGYTAFALSECRTAF